MVEQIRKGQNELAFKTMYFERGDLRKNPIFTLEMSERHPKHPSYELGLGQASNAKTESNPTTPELKNQAKTLYTTAQEQEGGFKELLQSIPGQYSLEAGNLLKSEQSLERKLASKQVDISAIGDVLRAAIRVEDRGHLNGQLTHVEDSLRAQGIEPIIEFHHRSSQYKGLHVQFTYKGIPSEVQLHTNSSWGTKKELDPIYHIMRDPQELAKLTPQELENLKLKSRQIAQDLDLDISDFTSYMVKSDSTQSSEKSVLVRKSPTEGKPTQEPLEKSNSNAPSLVDLEVRSNAYNRPDSVLRENANFSGGKGNNLSSGSGNIQTPLPNPTKPPLNNQTPLLPYKPNTQIPATTKEILAAGRNAHLDKQDILDAIRFKNKLLEDILKPNPAFGENFKEFALKGKEAVAKLLQEKRGQVAGAFYRPDLGESGGYIDLVWGSVGGKGKEAKGLGLSKIIEKHLDDFSPFGGNTPLEKLGNGIEEIIKSGDLVTDQAGVKTIILKDNGKEFRVEVSQGWKHKGKNYWIVTAYENRKSPTQKFDQVVAKSGHGSNLAQKDGLKDTTTPLKAQENLKVQELLQKAYGEWKAGKLPQEAGFQEAIQELLGQAVYKPQFNKDAKAFLKHSYGHSDLEFVLDKYRVNAYGDGIQAEMQGIAHIKEAIENPNYVRQNKDGDLMFIKEVSPNRFVGVHLNMGLGRNGEHNKGSWGILSREGFEFELGIDKNGTKTFKPTDKGYSQEELAQFKEGRRLADIERVKEQEKERQKMAAKEAKAKPPLKKPKDYKQPQSLEGLEELPKIAPKDPINQSFGKNYPRYANKGQEGLLALMYERTMLDGQIANAYRRAEIGGIDVYTQYGGEKYMDAGRIAQESKGLETFKTQPQEFLTPVGREAQIQAQKDFKKWRNMTLPISKSQGHKSHIRESLKQKLCC